MSTLNDEQLDEQAFQDFLNGHGELARDLQALPQSAPPEALDARILAYVQTDLEKDRKSAPTTPRVSIAEASNDASAATATTTTTTTVTAAGKPRPIWSGHRWKWLALAASIVLTVSVFLNQRPTPTLIAQADITVSDADAVILRGAESNEHGASQPTLSVEEQREAQTWLKEIEKLQQSDKKQEAAREWGKFKNAYPSYPVAPALANQLDALMK